MKAFHSTIDTRKWPGHASNAPPNAEELSATALEWFRNDPEWNSPWADKNESPEFLSVVVTGPWSIKKKTCWMSRFCMVCRFLWQ